MSSLFKSTDNTRAVLPDSLRYIRSDLPAHMTQEETDFLLARNIRTLVDLRTAEEAERKPCPLKEDCRFTYLSLPVTGGGDIPPCREAVGESYIRMADGAMREILAAITGAPTGVLYFCNAGKDRTGVVSAILQKAFGLTDEYVLYDYTASGVNLREKLEAFARANPAVDIGVITPKREYMERFLWWYRENEFDLLIK